MILSRNCHKFVSESAKPISDLKAASFQKNAFGSSNLLIIFIIKIEKLSRKYKKQNQSISVFINVADFGLNLTRQIVNYVINHILSQGQTRAEIEAKLDFKYGPSLDSFYI